MRLIDTCWLPLSWWKWWWTNSASHFLGLGSCCEQGDEMELCGFCFWENMGGYITYSHDVEETLLD